jgi:hypothetical protein
MRALLVTSDLMISSHVEGAAMRHGTGIDVVRFDEIPRVQLESFDLVILDLRAVSGNLADELPRLRNLCPATTKLLAFGPHVHRSNLDAARAAGFDLVLSRGEFHARVDQLLAG